MRGIWVGKWIRLSSSDAMVRMKDEIAETTGLSSEAYVVEFLNQLGRIVCPMAV